MFNSVKDLDMDGVVAYVAPNTKVRGFIEGWNKRDHPFVWTKNADQIFKKADHPTTSNPRH